MSFRSSEEAALRNLIAAEQARQRAAEETPWESGVVGFDWRNPPPDKAQLVALELRALIDVLVGHGVIKPDAVSQRLVEVEQEREQAHAAAQAEQDAAKQAKLERTVACADCQTVIKARDSYMSGRGALCHKCHAINP